MSKTTALRLPSPARDLRSHEITLSWVNNCRDTSPQPETLTIGELEKRFSVPETQRGKLCLRDYCSLNKNDPRQKRIRDAEKDGQAFIPATFKHQDTRLAAEVVLVHGFTLDFDGTAAYEEFQPLLDGICHIAYTSYSHNDEENRWRIFIPYAAAVGPEFHTRVWKHFNEQMPGLLDPRSATLNQLWYTPACPHDATEHFQSFLVEGDLFDPTSLPDVEPDETARIASLAVADTNLIEALKHIPADDRDIWIRVGMGLKAEIGEEGLNIWLNWSQTSEKYDEDDARYNWNSFQPREQGITLGTVYYYAIQNGWTPQADAKALADIAELNATYFIAREGGKTCVFREGKDPETGSFRLERLSPSDFRQYFSNRLVNIPGTKRQEQLGTYWLNHKDRRQYEEVVFQPNGNAPGCYNLWCGFAVQPISGSWELMKRHLLEVICDGNVDVFRYVICWMAFAVQHPDKPAETALILRGERGTGKGIFLNALGHLFGQNFTQVTQARHLVGNFNGHLRHCVFLFVDEALWAGDKQGENTLKALITEPTLLVERKGIDPFTVQNRLHIAMASNNDWVIPAGAMERRFVVLDVSSAHIQDHKYFEAMKKEMKNGGYEAMLHELLHYDLSEFNIRAIPKTDALREQVLRTMQGGQRWWHEELVSGELWRNVSPDQPVSVARFSLLMRYRLANPNVRNERSNQTQLGMLLRKVLPAEGAGSGPSEYKLAPLIECRRHFEGMVGFIGLFPAEPSEP